MTNDDLLTDEFVADMLAKEAQDCSLKFSAMGMEAFRSNKKPENIPKPNTRFLRHIIKDTDTHNKALLAKEAVESKARLNTLEQANEAKRLKTNPNSRDIRRRQMGDIQAILGGKKRGKASDEKDRPRSGNQSRTDNDDERRSSKQTSDLFSDRTGDRSERGRLRRNESDEERRGRGKRLDDRRSGRLTREDDSESEEDTRRRKHRSRHHRSRSPKRRHRSRSKSPRHRRKEHRQRSPVRGTNTSQKRRDLDTQDSDPLDDLIGPMPAPKPRGRGALAGSSGIDDRFSETYDPKTDILMEDESNTGCSWDDAVEAYRDRQKLLQNQSERLRAAGFTGKEPQHNQGGEGRLEVDVTWTKAGERREWDKGKKGSLLDADFLPKEG